MKKGTWPAHRQQVANGQNGHHGQSVPKPVDTVSGHVYAKSCLQNWTTNKNATPRNNSQFSARCLHAHSWPQSLAVDLQFESSIKADSITRAQISPKRITRAKHRLVSMKQKRLLPSLGQNTRRTLISSHTTWTSTGSVPNQHQN